ncbi:unnamed protein product, partial [marine sediment metagenome]
RSSLPLVPVGELLAARSRVDLKAQGLELRCQEQLVEMS